MEDFTVISYSSIKDNNLLSLNDSRSAYMLPFGGRFRVIDFTIYNSLSSGARSVIIYNNINDNLEAYVKNYSSTQNSNLSPIKITAGDYSDIMLFYKTIMDGNSHLYIFFNGDNPSIINFKEVIEKFKKKRTKAAAFRMKTSGKSSPVDTLLVIRQDALLSIINKFIDKGTKTKNVFELIKSAAVKKGTKSEPVSASSWRINDIFSYYAANMDITKKPGLSAILHDASRIRSFIRNQEFAFIGPKANISGSFISDCCKIHGTVINSIIFPGADIGENTIIKNSIILPFVKIGRGAKITNTIVDERTDLSPENNYLNIGNKCKIGSEYEGIENKEFPRLLYNSITLIGKDCRIPDEASIGGACYVASGKGEQYLVKNKFLYNGESLK